MIIDKQGHIAKITSSGQYGKRGKSVYHNWWSVIADRNSYTGLILIGTQAIHVPKELIGSKVRFKLEIIENEPMVMDSKSDK